MIDAGASFLLGGPPAQVQRADADLMLMRFKAACMRGEIRFRAEEVAEAPPESLPKALQPSLHSSGDDLSLFYAGGGPRSLKIAKGKLGVFQFTTPKPAYLITFTATSPLRSYEYAASCNMAIQGIPLSYAWKVLTGEVYSDTLHTRRGTNVRLGAVQTYPDTDHLMSGKEIEDGYTLLQVATLNDHQRTEVQAEQAVVEKHRAKPARSFQLSK